jgi:amidase
MNQLVGLEEQAQALAAGEVTSVELVERAVKAAEATQGNLNAFRVLLAEEALAEAAEADRRLAAGERAPLLGVPVVIKDDVNIAGQTTEIGMRGDFPVKTEDCAMVRRLRESGAVIIGKTTCPELAVWPIGDSDACGTTRNPWNLEHSPGGSSSGVAASVASGIVAAGIGSDGAGSIRIPAAWTHLVGIKPQVGRISTMPHPEMVNALAVLGPLARTVRDAALLLDVVSGGEPGDLHRCAEPKESFRAAADRDPGRLRIGLSLKPPFSVFPGRLDPEVRAQVERLANVLRDLGHEVVEVDMPYRLIGANLIPRAMSGLRDAAVDQKDYSLLDPRVRGSLSLGKFLGGPVLKAARAWQPRLERRVGKVFEQVDVVIAPTTAKPPFGAQALRGLSTKETDSVVVGACPFAWPWNVLGWPGVNVPAGLTRDRLPVGAQLLGPAESEALLISLAAQLEQVERWQDLWPPLVVGAGADFAAGAVGGAAAPDAPDAPATPAETVTTPAASATT